MRWVCSVPLLTNENQIRHKTEARKEGGVWEPRRCPDTRRFHPPPPPFQTEKGHISKHPAILLTCLWLFQECSGSYANTQGPKQQAAATLLFPAFSPRDRQNGSGNRSGVYSDLMVVIGCPGRSGGKMNVEKDRDTLMGHTLEFKNNPEEDAP